ncbi:hypothetical protein CKO12_12840 [Chromatium okenii]|uniref:hypothetical protein n=1 Tax=Chromatium okenii TaxID=61644 RepID=UPI00190626AD|nr:hypothetical protein [Chromatium okenii]MBK1642740.1 hypothetical protein [Chromatium okenii]
MAESNLAEMEERKRQRVRLTRLEADLAYFQARLQLIDDSPTRNHLAQRKVFHLLSKMTVSKIQKIKQRYADLR